MGIDRSLGTNRRRDRTKDCTPCVSHPMSGLNTPSIGCGRPTRLSIRQSSARTTGLTHLNVSLEYGRPFLRAFCFLASPRFLPPPTAPERDRGQCQPLDQRSIHGHLIAFRGPLSAGLVVLLVYCSRSSIDGASPRLHLYRRRRPLALDQARRRHLSSQWPPAVPHWPNEAQFATIQTSTHTPIPPPQLHTGRLAALALCLCALCGGRLS